ncbi:LysR family transcriptional regulator [Pseudomonas syringae]|uniref:LysR family transcriptional regulator n=1 Tax=Pseudomonas syringae TaxID=317 RepID=UPI00028F1FE0|nr:LysR family transcriptional regulator [Pseudomonas syringae]EKG35839.1 transcriptional regulator, LysR family [Pseudomonas syringae pv. avellanae str. ISPaVe037]WIX26178.1 LysR family transcriptional regulator [Xanthomonas arboricola pv. corylina]
MSANDPFGGLAVFLAVARHNSFRGAAQALCVSTAAVSKAIRQLEARHAVVLFQRTTRRVGLTDAGAALYASVHPASVDIDDALARLRTQPGRPSGHLRITASHVVSEHVLAGIVPEFRCAYPDITLDIDSNDGFVDLIARGYDAGIRLDNAVEKDMLAVRMTPPVTWSVVATPDYFARHGRPTVPLDLKDHEAIRYRFAGSGRMHRWEFRDFDRHFTVDVAGGLVVNSRAMLVAMARQGQGLAFVSNMEVADAVQAGELEAVLQEFIPPDDGLYLYFPARSQSQPKLRAFIELINARRQM